MPNPNALDQMMGGILTERERNPHASLTARLQDSASLADYLRAERERRIARIRAGTANGAVGDAGNGLALAREFSDLMDAVLTRMFTLACERAGSKPASVPIAIVATGGYGRRELCPFSDIDITFIPQRDGDPLTDRLIRDMFTQVMDVCIARCGLEVGYAYRLLEDCNALDHQTASGLLDARLITGNDRLFIQFEDAYWMGFNPTDFIFTKIAERESGLEKWGRTPRVVEPQVKEGPGGLRDLQTAVWLMQARRQLTAARVRGPRALEALARECDIPASDAAGLAAAKERLFQVRNALHAITGAERDQLVITRQEEVAALLGYAEEVFNSPESPHHLITSSPHQSEAPPVERFMAALYPSLALVRRVTDQVIRQVGNSRLILGIGLDCKRRKIVPANSSLESDDPVWLLWASELAQKYGLQFSQEIERAAVALVSTNPILSEPAQAAQVFTLLLSRVGKIYPILQTMADLGILGWFLPEFGLLMDLIPYDPSHDHTVGQHSLLLVKHLEALSAPDGEEQTEMKRILEDLPHPEQLLLACLLHDSGKAYPGRPHSEVGEEIAADVCRRLGWTEEATANVLFLIREHLLMAETSRLRDLQLEETLRDFTRVVDDLDRLNMLYLLTYADTRAVGEGVWTQVKGRFLRELWRRAASVLSDEEPVGYDDAAIARARRRLLKDLSLENLPENEVAEHIGAMPPHYLLNQTQKAIALHIGYIRRVREGQPVVELHSEREATYSELTVCALDDPKPGLLAKIVGALYAADVNVHSAQVMTRVTEQDRIALDTLWVDYRGRQLSPGKRREVSENLNAVLTGSNTVADLLQKPRFGVARRKDETPSKQSLSLTDMTFRSDLADSLAALEITAADTPGAFYLLCEAFSRLGWDIRSARISIWHGQARTGFTIAGAGSLTEAEAKRALQQVLTREA